MAVDCGLLHALMNPLSLHIQWLRCRSLSPENSQVDPAAAQDLALFQLSPLCSESTSPSMPALPGDVSPGCALS